MRLLVRDAVRVEAGDCREVMPRLAAEGLRFDAVVTDPPYGLKFMGKEWDDPKQNAAFKPETWQMAMALLKPGGHLLAFGGPRTYHRIATAIEDAGFEIRDCLMWLFGSGFPKSLDVGKAIDKAAGAERDVVALHRRPDKRGGNYHGASEQRATIQWAETAPATEDAKRWDGWGTALKPAYEPIVLARRPLAGTVAANVLAHGVGALNVEGCRVEAQGRPARVADPKALANGFVYAGRQTAGGGFDGGSKAVGTTDKGRHPANLVLDEEAAAALDAQSGILHSGFMAAGQQRQASRGLGGYANGMPDSASLAGTYGDSGGASRFFYTSKAGAADRFKSKHPTVKPHDLMRWLCRLVCPPDGLILDPFAGTGSTGEAAWAEGFRAVLIEEKPEYLADIDRRLHECAPLLAGGM